MVEDGRSNKPWRSHTARKETTKVKEWTNIIRRKKKGKTLGKGGFDIQITDIRWV